MVSMMKKYAFLIIIIVMTLGFFTGNYLYKINKIKTNKIEEEGLMGKLIEDECTAVTEYGTDLISTNSKVKKTSPNCLIVLKIYYRKCGHLVESKKNIEEGEVNLTEEELKKKFPDWELQKFTSSEIVLYKEVDEFCNEHYLLKEKDGTIAVFSLDENNNEKLERKTNIFTNYLEEDDLEKLRSGIYINSKKELNKALEDFE